MTEADSQTGETETDDGSLDSKDSSDQAKKREGEMEESGEENAA